MLSLSQSFSDFACCEYLLMYVAAFVPPSLGDCEFLREQYLQTRYSFIQLFSNTRCPKITAVIVKSGKEK